MRAFATPTDLPYELRSLLTLERGGRCERCGAPVGVASLVQVSAGPAYSVDDFRLLCRRGSSDAYARDNAGRRGSEIHLEMFSQNLKCPPPSNLRPEDLAWLIYACGLKEVGGPGAKDWAKVKGLRANREEKLRNTRRGQDVGILNDFDVAAVAGILDKIQNRLSSSYAQAALDGMKSLDLLGGVSRDEELASHIQVENVYTLSSTEESPEASAIKDRETKYFPELTKWLLSWGFVSLEHYTTLTDFADRYGKLAQNAPQYQQALRANAEEHNVDVEKNSLLLQMLPYIKEKYGAFARVIESPVRTAQQRGGSPSVLLGPSATQLDNDSDALLKAVGVATSGKQEQILGPSARKNPGKIHQDQQAR